MLILTACGDAQLEAETPEDPYGLGYSYTEFEEWLQGRDIETRVNDQDVLVGATWETGALIEISGPADNVRAIRLRFGPDATQQELETLEGVLRLATRMEFDSLREISSQVSPELPYETTEAIAYTDKLRVLVERSVETDRVQITVTRK